MPPRSLTACSSLPPEGALRLRTGEASSTALVRRVGDGICDTYSYILEPPRSLTACSSLPPPEGALRLRTGEASSTALV